MNLLRLHSLLFFAASHFFAATYAGAEATNDGSDTVHSCFVGAGERYGLNPYLLYAIAEKESSMNPVAINSRGIKDEDIGLMQINTFWFDRLVKQGITRNDLFDPCVSIYTGAWVLAHSIDFFGNNWEAVGGYNVGTSNKKWAVTAREKYATDIHRRYQLIVGKLF